MAHTTIEDDVEFPRVAEQQAEGKVKATFEDIKLTLGVGAVGRLFEELAPHPTFLSLAWRNLKPNASTVYFHRIAGELSEIASKSVGGERRHRTEADADVTPADARIDLESKLLVSAAALRYGTNGQVPKMLWLAASDKRTVTPKLATASPAEEPVPEADGKACWDLRQRAGLMVESLPFRMEISATACRQSGLTEDEFDVIRLILRAAWVRIPCTLLAGASGPRATFVTAVESAAAS